MTSNWMQSTGVSLLSGFESRRLFWVSVACLLALAVGGALPGLAQEETPQLLVDLEPGQVETSGFVDFANYNVGDRVLFWADDGRRGRELWITDGTEDGTRLWAEVCPGDCTSDLEHGFLSTALAFDGERIFWSFDDGIHGRELWTFDETMEGPRLVADLCPGPCDTFMRNLTLIEDRVYFAATGSDGRYHPWVSDGTAAGTRQLRDRLGGTAFGSIPNNFLPLGQDVAFTAQIGSTALEWFATDGTMEGTRQLTDAGLGFNRLFGLLPASLNGEVLFGVEGSQEYNLYRLSPDGDLERLATLCEGSDCDFNGPVRRVGERVFITRGEGLWSTDGTADGTRLEVQLPSFVRTVLNFEILDDGTFLVSILEDDLGERRIYRRIGTSLGELLFAVGPTTGLTVHDLGHQALVVQNFSGFADFWTTDGTAAGTQQYLRVQNPGLRSSASLEVGRQVVFTSSPLAVDFARELSATGGPQTDLVKLWELEERPVGSRPRQLTSVGSHAVFRAEALEDDLDDLWSIDCFGVTTPLGVDVEPEDLQRLDLTEGPRAFFTGIDATGINARDRVPWITDGTLDGTWTLSDSTGSTLTWGREPTVLDGQLFFLSDQGSGQKLWKTGVDEHSAQLVADLQPDYLNVHVYCGECSPPLFPTPIFPRHLNALGQGPDGRLVFVGGQDDTGAELWQSDGTAEGTSLLFDLRPGDAGSEPEQLLPAGSGLVFTADDGDGRRLYFWDGESETPDVLGDFEEMQLMEHDPSRAVWIVQQDDRFHLWTSDGTPAGTLELTALPEGVVPEDSGVLARDRLFFAAADGSGAELWVANLDASAPEIQPVVDLWPGYRGSFPQDLRLLGDQLYFSADNGQTGRELWRIDLQRETLQPQPVGDVAPGVEPSSPREMVRLEAPRLQLGQDAVVFSADDGSHGRELWTVPFIGNRQLCRTNATTLCLREGRFRITVNWRDDINGTEGVGRVIPAGDESGFFWFFDANNLELTVKVIDGRDFNDAHWFFYGALSDVAYDITVEDLTSGARRVYSNSQGNLCGQGDSDAFPEADAGDLGPPKISEVPGTPRMTARREVLSSPMHREKIGGCLSSPTQHCLLDRFEVTVDWIDHDGNTGQGQAALSNGQTGLFWFFDQENIELAVKAIDGTDFNGSFWIFYGALTDVRYSLRVVDTVTGEEVVYQNPSGNLCGQGDTSAFPVVP